MIRIPAATTTAIALVATLGLLASSGVQTATATATECFDCGEMIMLEDFAGPKHKWVEMNDPVMGGRSTGSFTVGEKTNLGVFHGSVEIVPFLKAPGFIKAETTKGESWPDVSSCDGLRFVVKSTTPSYQGFKVSFGQKRPPDAFPYTYGFKSDMALPEKETNDDGTDDDGFVSVKLPFDNFTDKWDAGTGNAVVTCAENKEYCPDEASKKDLFSIAVWGEGVEGEVDMEIQSISAYGCAAGKSNTENNSDPVAVAASSSSSSSDAIVIEDFSNPTLDWRTMNDPVMGGQSVSSLSIEGGVASFDGTCAIVPFLHAPGFITMTTGMHKPPNGFGRASSASSQASLFPDVSSCKGLSLVLRSRVDYEGYYVSFGNDRAPGGRYAMGYKRHLVVPLGDSSNDTKFLELSLPFSDFSSHWDDATGKTTVTCHDDPSVCPSESTLRNMETISLWGEGVEGTVALDVRSIGAYGCASSHAGGDDASGVLSASTASLRATASVHSPATTSSSSIAIAPRGTMLGMIALCSGIALVVGLVVGQSLHRRPEDRGYKEVDRVEATPTAVPEE
mmetsp:Transcript_6518/g.15493  ORF Transcript_6518/g.15493 Transcript_6518/m.15493 type:complete len:563 (+) Transcript_6518:54-1742(+)|eukprot:CAMPEP_0201136356 /NCGR_PEP_ID=MMETSP0850-20130426/54840_1 /ASSEMBLY_ACC=CAM_ASM_000622 /TAXON_ID=183588 /ORGANISM="Pseudo-nitzschia fraudulenta, Strain WWA7" /LENGTH=562 /DNA_ID=CAMNT_0047407649 /DNA_START=41 /DNA_END=1729 /DNA_ORIENTATION=+